ncbi:Putative major facilitator, sugar transporter, major facilitator superfamily [Colletotrichum destructivum]|uniref:Major facilitator, sugar transporter, major facilitator superfamily n=1 Tax=Colletotrichum destructivum TaxID=34406 RepID=A0AAX4I0L7_9PEZI|nr:Putative major facilitator, sugar transporter, major facilitator superfamily [Colletotrichum destructivum]
MEKAAGDTIVSPALDRPLWRRGHLLKLNFITLSMVFFSSANGYDGSIMGGLLALPFWNRFMHHPSGAYLGWISAIYWVGNFIGFPIAAWVANRYGRRAGLYLGFPFLLLGVVMQTAAQNEAMFTYSRLSIGFASAWFGNSAPLLINEIAHPKQRSITNAMFMVGWYFGGTLCGWVVFACRDIASDWCWRIPVLVQITLPLMALPGVIMAPESPRWLFSVGRVEEATEILSINHAGGDRNDPLVTRQAHEIQTAIIMEKESHTNASYADMFKTPGNRHRLFISVTLGVFSQWAGNGIVSYYLPLILNSIGVTSTSSQTLISACLNVWNLLWAIAAATSVDRLGRRFLFLTSASIMLVSFIIITGLSATFAQTGAAAVGLAVIPILFIFFAGYDIAMTPFLTAYPCEIWSFTQRSRGLTVTWCASVVALFLNTFANPLALEAIQWRYYIVYIVMLALFAITVYFAYPETRGFSLERIAVIFDGDDADVILTAETREKTDDPVISGDKHA